MRACATIKKHLVDHNGSGNRVDAPDDEKQPKPCVLAVDSKDDCDKDITNVSDGVGLESARPNRKKDLVLDAREPHVVKYDLSKKERQKLDMHTDKSVWTFLIALSEGRGFDYGEG